MSRTPPPAARFGMATDPRIVELFGYEEVTYADGEAVIVWRPGDLWTNGQGGVFGGLVASVVDHATGVAVFNAAGPDIEAVPHVSMSIDYMRPLKVGHVYRATGTPLRIGGRLAVAACTIRDADDVLCVNATATIALVRNRSRA